MVSKRNRILLDDGNEWMGILRSYEKDMLREDRNILSYGFYEFKDSYSPENDLFVPFLLLKDNSGMSDIERAATSGNKPLKFSGEFFELGDFGKYTGAVSRDRLAIRRDFENEEMGKMICVGSRLEDNFYHGYWGYENSDWKGNFKMIFDLESPLSFFD